MSGTSLDGVDGVLVRIAPHRADAPLQLATLAFAGIDMPQRQQRVRHLQRYRQVDVDAALDPHRFQLIPGSVCDHGLVDELVARHDVVVHFAAEFSIRISTRTGLPTEAPLVCRLPPTRTTS